MNENEWVKASASTTNGNCVKVAWRKASASGGNGGNCVEVAFAAPEECSSVQKLGEVAQDGLVVLIRDSKDPDGSALSFTKAEWVAFLDGAKKGEFDDLLVGA